MRRSCILDHGNHYQTILAVEADDGRPPLLMPFAGQSIAKAVMVDDDRIFCLSQDGACCLLDWRSGRELASGRTRNLHANVFITRDARFVVLHSSAILHVLRADDLTPAIEADAVRWRWGGRQGQLIDSCVHTSARAAGGPRRFQPSADSRLFLQGPLIEGAAGQLLIQLYEQRDNEGKRYGLYHIDPESWTVRLDLFEQAYDYPILNWFRWFSPSGRYAVRWHLGSLAYDSGARPAGGLFGFGKRPAPKHRDAIADGNKRFGLALEIWSTDPLAFQTSIVARLQALGSAADEEFWRRRAREREENLTRFAAFASGPPQARLPLPDPRTLSAEMLQGCQVLVRQLQEFMEWIEMLAWEPDETAFWLVYAGPALRRVGADGSLSPLFTFRRLQSEQSTMWNSHFFPPLGLDFSRPDCVRFGSDRQGYVSVQRSWCASDLPEMAIAEHDDGFELPSPFEPGTHLISRFMREQAVHQIALPDLSAAAVAEALRTLTRAVRERLADLLRKDVLETTFIVGGEAQGETEFFERIARDRIAVAAELRDLLECYLAVQPGVLKAKRITEQIWGPDGQGALGPAMWTLLRLDPARHDVFRDYLAKRDGEHEIYTTDVMMRDYVTATGWRDEPMIRFGIYFALIRERDGRMSPAGLLNEYGLVDAAADRLDPEAFARMVVEEIEGFYVALTWDDQTKDTLYRTLENSLRSRAAFGARVLAAIARLRPMEPVVV